MRKNSAKILPIKIKIIPKIFLGIEVLYMVNKIFWSTTRKPGKGKSVGFQSNIHDGIFLRK